MSGLITVVAASILMSFANLSAQEQLNASTPAAQDVSARQEGSPSKKRYLSHFLQLEPSVLLEPEDVVFSLNISANFSEKGPEQNHVIPYVTAGYGMCLHEMGILNGGGGMKVRLGETLGVRAELLYYRYEEEGSVTEGVAWFLGVTSFF
jgi:hypothetical protein